MLHKLTVNKVYSIAQALFVSNMIDDEEPEIKRHTTVLSKMFVTNGCESIFESVDGEELYFCADNGRIYYYLLNISEMSVSEECKPIDNETLYKFSKVKDSGYESLKNRLQSLKLIIEI